MDEMFNGKMSSSNFYIRFWQANFNIFQRGLW